MMEQNLQLPPYLKISLENMIKSWELVDSGQKDLHWDLCWCELNADINAAEVDGLLTNDEAWSLREKYLRMNRPEQIRELNVENTPVAREEMNEAVFDEMMRIGLNQAKMDVGNGLVEVFLNLRQEISQILENT